MTDPTPQSEIILYQTEDGQTRIECRFENETIWLTQKLMAELFQKDVRTINEHIQNVISEGELPENSVIRKFRITAADGKSYETRHYRLEMILAVGYRVRSPRGTQFRQWATSRLTEYLVKGFTMDDKRMRYSTLSMRRNSIADDGSYQFTCVSEYCRDIMCNLFRHLKATGFQGY